MVLKKEQIEKLEQLGIHILVPQIIPNGYKIKDVKAIYEEFTGPGTGNHYEIHYSKNSNSFVIESTAGGIGDIFSKEVKIIKTQFGDIRIYKENNCILSSWIEYKNHFYRIISTNYENNSLSISELEETLKSLVLIDNFKNCK